MRRWLRRRGDKVEWSGGCMQGFLADDDFGDTVGEGRDGWVRG